MKPLKPSDPKAFDNPPPFSTPWYLNMESAHHAMTSAKVEVGVTTYAESSPGIWRIVTILAIEGDDITVRPDRSPETTEVISRSVLWQSQNP